MSYHLEIESHVSESGTIHEVCLAGLYNSADIEDLLRLRDRLNMRASGDVIIDVTKAYIDTTAEGAFASIGRDLAKHGRMLHLVVGERGRPNMADINARFQGISFHKDMRSAMESAGAVTVAA